MGSVRTNTWPTMGPQRDERGLPKMYGSQDVGAVDLSSSLKFSCGPQTSSGVKTGSIQVNVSDQKPVEQKRYTSKQWMTIVGLAFGNFTIGSCTSLQAPFFPHEAERKGATATEYGIVFGVYQLTFLIGSLVFGKVVGKVSPSFMLTAGIFVVASASFMFGVLHMAPSPTFIPLSVAVRIAEGVGSVATKTATCSIIGAQFPDTVATTFASMETFMGVGLIVGPTMGGFLYQLGGFPTPFMVTGCMLLLNALVVYLVLPKDYPKVNQTGELLKFWKSWNVIYNFAVIFTSFIYLGFIQVALEPHIRHFNLSAVIVGLVFIVNGATYAVTSPLLGKIVDRGVNLKCVTAAGCLTLIVSQAMLGPASFLPFGSKLWMVLISLFLCGLGAGGKLVPAFVSTLRKATARGFPDDFSTFGLVSTVFTSSLSLGAFTGPTLGGYLSDTWGVRHCCTALMAVETVMLLVTLASLLPRLRNGETTPLVAKKETPRSHFEASYSQIF